MHGGTRTPPGNRSGIVWASPWAARLSSCAAASEQHLGVVCPRAPSQLLDVLVVAPLCRQLQRQEVRLVLQMVGPEVPLLRHLQAVRLTPRLTLAFFKVGAAAPACVLARAHA